MANEYAGADLLLKTDSNLVGGQTDVQFNWTRGSEAVGSKTTSNYQKHLSTIMEWGVDVDGMGLFGSEAEEVTGSGFSFDVWDVNASTPMYEPVGGFRTCTISMEQEFADLSNGTVGNYRIFKPRMRTLSIEYERVHTAAHQDAGYRVIQEALNDNTNGSDVSIKLSGISGLDLAPSTDGDLNAIVVDGGFDGPNDDASTQTLQFNYNGSFSLADQSNQDAGLYGLLNALDNQTKFESLINIVDPTDNSPVSGHYKYTGDTYVQSIEITIPWDGPIEVSTSLRGTGLLSIAAQN